MKREIRQKVVVVAKEVRSWAESLANKKPFAYESDLCGLCAIASAKLHKELKKQKIASEIHIGYGHVFLVVENHIVDVTATQFGLKEKVVIKPNVGIEESHWKGLYIFKSARSLRMAQKRDGWPREQIALS